MLNPKFLYLFCILRQLICLKFCSFCYDEVAIFAWTSDLMLLLQGLLLLQTNFGRFFQCKLRVLTVDAFGVDCLTLLFDFNLNFQKVLGVDFA